MSAALLVAAACSLVDVPFGLQRARPFAPLRVRDTRLDLLDWLEDRLRDRRERRQVERRPQRIILVRHGQSEGNTNKAAYTVTPDSQIAITPRGWAQGVVAGQQIKRLVGNGSVRCFHSPYLRAQQTLLAILQAFDARRVMISSEPRLREQDFGNFQEPAKMDEVMRERQEFGRFYYRFPNGEAGTDVFDRMASFINYLFRSMDQTIPYFARDYDQAAEPVQNYVLVTHGLLMRIFCMCYLRWTVAEFEQVWNPSNGEIWVFEKRERGIFELAGRWRTTSKAGKFVDLKFGKSRNEPMFAHMKSPLVSRPVTPGQGALDALQLSHLRDFRGPRGPAAASGWRRPINADGESLEYWGIDENDPRAH
jgi:broad specificity phosphatase PhoE